MFRQAVQLPYIVVNVNLRITTLSLLTLALAGCQRDAVTSYTIPKEDYSVRVASAPAPSGHEDPARPHVHWELPQGWQEGKGDGMSVGRFRIPGDGGKTAEVTIVPMPGADRIPNLEEQSVEMWKSNLGIDNATNAPEPVQIAGAKGRLYDLSSDKGRLTAGVATLNGTMWFVRMSGDAAVVGKQQQAFRGFLKSLSIHEESEEAPASQAKWPGAEGWTAATPGQMILAAYSVKGKANVTVTAFPGDVGGMFANVNRWRRQMGLEPVSEADVPKFTKDVTLSDGTKATAVEISGAGNVTYALVLSRDGKTWFYKIVGPAEIVEAEKTHLSEFAVRAKE